MVVRKLEIFADYHQFYLQDERATGDLSDAWTPAAVEQLLALVEGTIGVGTIRDDDVPVEVELASSQPPDDFDDWGLVNECSIDVPTGCLVVAGCTDYFPDAVRIDVPAGTYRARVYYGGLDTLSDDGTEGDDHYRVVLWSGTACSPRTLKGRRTG